MSDRAIPSPAACDCCLRMARPRKAEDPDSWPVPCGRCGQHHQLVAIWPDAAICVYCYQRAKRTRGTCACGHDGVLPGRIDGRPACRRCSGVSLNVDCRHCGAEDELYDGSRCWTCVLAATVDELLTNPETAVMAPQLATIATALKSMKRSNSGLTWIKQAHVSSFLSALATAPRVTHDSLDELPASRTRDYVRGLLVEHGALLRRDERAARFSAWSQQALSRLRNDAHRDVIQRYIRWQHQRRMNDMDAVPHGTFLRSKQTVTVAIDFLNWLDEHKVELANLEQSHLDAWQAGGPSTREIASRFLSWATRTRLVRPDVKMTAHRRGTSPKLSAQQQVQAVQRVVHSNELNPRDRAAATLVIVFAQQIEHVVRLTWDAVTVNDEIVSIRLGATETVLPAPLDEPFRELAATPGHDLTAAHPNTNWVFRGHSPGRHIDPTHLRGRLKAVFSTRAARLGTLHELTRQAPVAIIAEVLGYSPATIERHTVASAATYAQYVAALIDPGPPERLRATDKVH